MVDDAAFARPLCEGSSTLKFCVVGMGDNDERSFWCGDIARVHWVSRQIA
jgi:hypothetical protein